MNTKPAPIDLKALVAVAQEQDRLRRSTLRVDGPMTAFRAVFPTVERLREEGVAWVSIAAALDRAGVRRADAKALDAKYVAAMYSTLKRRAERKTARRAERAARSDLPKAQQTAKVNLASDAMTLNSFGPIADDNDPAIVKSRLEEAAAQANSRFFKPPGDQK